MTTSNEFTDALAGASDTRAIVAGLGVLDRTGAVFLDVFGALEAHLVADENTWAVAGEEVVASLREAGVPVSEPLVLPGSPSVYASYENVEMVRDHLSRRGGGCAVVIGSGTLNDLVKLASGELGRPYLVVATAASMDGYAAYGASITKAGFKITQYCPAPTAVIADHRVMAQAPRRLTATGVGDLIEKIPAGADWLIADALEIEPIERSVWDLVQAPLRASLADPDRIAVGDESAIASLADGLLMSGLAMQAHRSSRPASGAGHQFSHLWEMEGLGRAWEPPLSHGKKVGLGTIALCALYEVVLRRDLATLDVDAAVRDWPAWAEVERRIRAADLPSDITAAALEQSHAKFVSPARLRSRLERLREVWPALSRQLRDQLVPASEVRATLETVGAVTHPEQIALTLAQLRSTYARAQMIRSRYTVLDLLLEAGLLEECVAELFAPDGYWGSSSVPAAAPLLT